MPKIMPKTTIVHGLRDGRHTANTSLLVRKILALGAKVSVASTGRVTVIDRNGKRHVYELALNTPILALDTGFDASPLRQALTDLELAAQKTGEAP